MQPSRVLSTAVLCGVFAFALLSAVGSTNFDFRAFYCAGHAGLMRADPYRTEPLHTCERTQTDSTFAAFFRDVALPAPQPGYDVAAFSLLARLPFGPAAKIWSALLVLCSVGSVLLLRRVTQAPLAAVAVALWLSSVTSIYLGEIVPFCLCAIAAAALFAQNSRFTAAGIAAAAALVEPHIGIPVCLSVALWLPKSRIALGASVLLLAGVSIAMLGLAQNVQYVASVLPAHALSEIGSDAQLSLSAILHGLGMGDAAALKAGTVSFALITLLALAAAPMLARRFGDPAFIVAVPSALAVTGGVFMHVTEIAAALPLALLLIRYARAERRIAVIALLLLAVPWWSLATPMLFGTATGVVLTGIALFYLIHQYVHVRPIGALALAILAGAGVSAVLRWHDMNAIHTALHAAPAAILGAVYPEASWKWFNDAYMSTGSGAAWLLRVATWMGLCLVIWAALHKPKAVRI